MRGPLRHGDRLVLTLLASWAGSSGLLLLCSATSDLLLGLLATIFSTRVRCFNCTGLPWATLAMLSLLVLGAPALRQYGACALAPYSGLLLALSRQRAQWRTALIQLQVVCVAGDALLNCEKRLETGRNA